jgi:acetaldehyde dehydrogenase (acetylating)
MTLGCGAIAGNITSDNVGPMHLLNIKRIAFHVRDADTAFESEEAKALQAGRSLTPIAPASARVPVPLAREAASAAGGSKIADAVSRYLAERGMGGAGGPIASGGSAAPVARSASVTSPVAAVVDKFLAGRGNRPAAKSNPASCGTAAAPSNPTPPIAPQAKDPAPPAPPVDVAGFVCEDDVRRAMVLRKKIYINRKTIVTPAASDLNHSADVLVRTE